jgi:hypothetical protein
LTERRRLPLGLLEQLSDRNLQGLRDPGERGKRRISLSDLQSRDEGAVDAGFICEVFLGPTPLLPESLEAGGEGGSEGSGRSGPGGPFPRSWHLARLSRGGKSRSRIEVTSIRPSGNAGILEAKLPAMPPQSIRTPAQQSSPLRWRVPTRERTPALWTGAGPQGSTTSRRRKSLDTRETAARVDENRLQATEGADRRRLHDNLALCLAALEGRWWSYACM